MIRRYRMRFSAHQAHGLLGLMTTEISGNERRCSMQPTACNHTYEVDLEAYDAKDAVTQIETLFKSSRAMSCDQASFRLDSVRPAPLDVKEHE